MEYFKFLPVEIALDILSRLPIESVLDCKLVSTTWRRVIIHPSFSKKHLDRLTDSSSGKLTFLALTPSTEIGTERFEYFEYNESTPIHESTPIERLRMYNVTPPFKFTRIIGSCNGLICLCEGSSFTVRPCCVCNPVTKEYVMLPDYCDTDQYIHCTSGFGYVSSTNEYKVVVLYMLKKTKFLEVSTYTLGSGLGWRSLGNFNCKFRAYRWQHRQAIFANGVLYWLSHELKMIITFDLAEESFRANLTPPPLPLGNNWFSNRLGVLDGYLFYAVHSVVQAAQYYDIWLLRKRKDSHDLEELGEEHRKLFWSKEFRVYDSELLAVTKGNGVLCLWDKYINYYDTKVSTSKWIVDLKKLVVQVLPHQNTLVSLKELGEEETKKMKSVQVEESRSNDQHLKQL